MAIQYSTLRFICDDTAPLSWMRTLKSRIARGMATIIENHYGRGGSGSDRALVALVSDTAGFGFERRCHPRPIMAGVEEVLPVCHGFGSRSRSIPRYDPEGQDKWRASTRSTST